VITDTQTSIQRPSGLRRVETPRPLLVRLFTEHWVAKLVALLFAGVLVLLIDREITNTIVNAELFEVKIGDGPRGTPAPGQRVIILEKEPGVAIRSFQPNPVRVTIRGQQKLLEHMKTTTLVGRVSVKKDWLKKDRDRLLPTTQTIGGDSINFGAGAVASLEESIKVDLDLEVTREVPLVGAPKDVSPGLLAEVSFQPPSVKVIGPAYWLEGPSAIPNVTIPVQAAGRGTDYALSVSTLPDDYASKMQLRMAPGQQVTASVHFSRGEEKPLDVKDVQLEFRLTPKLAAEYGFAPIGLARESVIVTVKGAPEALAAWAGKMDELRKTIVAQIDVSRIVSKVAGQLSQAGSHTDDSGEVEVLRLPDNLKLVGVTPAQVDVTITKR
jgi:hypothetical protein